LLFGIQRIAVDVLKQYGILHWKRLSRKAEFNFANRIDQANPSAVGVKKSIGPVTNTDTFIGSVARALREMALGGGTDKCLSVSCLLADC
jgi:hypothetical protein